MSIMKKTFFYGAIITVIGICLFLVFKKPKWQTTPTSEVQQAASLQMTNTSQPSQNISVAPAQSAQIQIPASNESMQQKLGSLSNAVQNLSTQVHGQIEFYGKVIDENNQPIEGANIEFVWAQMFPLPEGTPSTNVISDREGLFSLSGAFGARLGVHVSKAGYYYVRNLNVDSFSYSTLPCPA